MNSNSRTSALTDRDIDDIQLLYQIARANGAHLSLNEAVSLLHSDVSEEEFALALNSSNGVKGSLRLQAGFIVSMDEAGEERLEVESFEREARKRAERNLAFAFEFADFGRGELARVLSVSGSSSYGSVSSGDDLDFFCITPSETLWLFITRLLILGRVFRAVKRNSPNLCLSCMMDEGYAGSVFRTTRDGLFARDALNISIIRGHDFYNKLLRESAWLSEYYPKLYRQRVSLSKPPHPLNSHGEPNVVLKVVNLFLYRLVGGYLRLKAYLGNRRLTRDGRYSLLFTAKIGTDHCIYESVRYSKLRRLYSKLGRLGETDAIALHS